MTDLLALFPWGVVLAVFFGMLAIVLRVIGALDRALERQQASPPAPPATVPRPPAPPVVLPPTPPVVVAPPTVPAGPFAGAPAWFTWAVHEIGTHEGPNNGGAAIERYIGLAHTGAPGDPWCAIFANAAMEASGVPGSRSASSQSFRTHPDFVQLPAPALGCIVVFWRGTRDSGLGHVGFYRGEDASRVWTLGGNEDDMVEIAALAKAGASFGLIGYWWPKGVPLPTGGPIIMPAGSPSTTRTPPADTAPVAPGGWITGITATMFGGDTDVEQGAYDGHTITAAEIGCSLPFRYPAPRPQVEARNPKTGASLVMPLVDVGPWNTTDDWLGHGARPRVEQQIAAQTKADNGRVPTNDAAIDLTVAAAIKLGIDGKGKLDVRIIPATTATAVT